MRIITKFDIRNDNIVKGINYEGVEKIGDFQEIYKKVNNYIKKNVNNNFEIILNDVTASLYGIKSGKENIKEILENKLSLPHIISGGIDSIEEVNNKMKIGGDRIMLNTYLHENISILDDINNLYGSQIIIPSIETRFINGDYYVYKNYGREETNITLINWIKELKKNNVIEILIISIDRDGTLEGYDDLLLNYLKQTDIFCDGTMSCLYAGGINNLDSLKDIEEKYSFITGVSISTLFYKKIEEKFYFLSYLEGNIVSVKKHFSKIYNCIFVNNIKEIPNNETICITGHYNSYILIDILKKHDDFDMLKKRIHENSIKYIGICSGLQILLTEIYDEFDNDKKIEGLDILRYKIIKCEKPNIGFKNNKFYCHLYKIIDLSNNVVNEYKQDNIEGYQYHPENSL
uniref:CobB/CobQ-like glutamine amidotransferase domain-containing protein n=1 Tax=viral metagenome TaxID=1070528 RepID=A0A6C0KGK0_9ZZZZ